MSLFQWRYIPKSFFLLGNPVSNGYSPVQLLMRRKHRTPFPELSSNLKRYLPNENFVKEREEKHRRRNKKNRHGGTKNLEQLAKGQYV